jgi:hypothetical protein
MNDPRISIYEVNAISSVRCWYETPGRVHDPTSLTLDVTLPPEDDRGRSDGQRPSISTLCEYLLQTKVITRVILEAKGKKFCPKDVGALALATSANANIENLIYSGNAKLPYDDFIAYVQKRAQFLKQLSMGMIWQYETLPESKKNALAHEVFRLPLLNSLSIYLDNSRGPTELLFQLLHSKQGLRTLVIVGSRSYDSAEWILDPLCSLLRSVPLESLELRKAEMNNTDMKRLLHGVQCCSTIASLSLCGDFTYATQKEILHFFRQLREAVSHIRKFCLRDNVSEIATILTRPVNQSMDSIGSKLQVLHLDDMPDIKCLMEALSTKGSQLLTLSFHHLHGASWRQLFQYLPYMMSLRDLTVKYVSQLNQNPLTADAFLLALRKNCSLQKVSIAYNGAKHIPFFSATNAKRVQLYCDRNQLAAGLLQCTVATEVLLSMCPSLWQVVKPAMLMAPNAILRGLLACGSMIGPLGKENPVYL